MSSIIRVSISQVDSSINSAFCSLSCEHLEDVCTNPLMPANERRTAEGK